MQGIWGDCEVCNSHLQEDGHCGDCQYREWKATVGTCQECGKELKLSLRPGTPLFLECTCKQETDA